MGHFKGKIVVWDVVNEAFNEDGSYRASFWYNKLGKSFIENAFIRARAADPGAKLIYNDYNLEATGSKSNAAYNMLKDFKSRGIPVDGIGFQMHLDIQYGFNYNDFASNMQRFADLGLEIYITEMDVRVSSNPSSAELQTQADYYKGVIQKCMAQPAVKAIQFWGFTDKYSWVPGTFPGRGAALLFDSNYNPKPAYYAAQTAIGSSPVTATPTQRQNTPTPTPSSGSRSAFSQIEAESYNSQSGIQTESCGEGGENIGYIENGDYAVYNNIDFGGGATGFEARVASNTSGGNIEIRLDSPSGTLVGTCSVAGTGGWQTWTTRTCSVSGATGTHNLILRFTGGSGYLFNVNWFRFTGGSGNTPTPTQGATYVRFRNVATGLYIDGMGSTSNGSNACQYSSSSSYNQQWTLEAAGGYYKIKNRATGLYLDGMGRTSNGSICGQWSASSSYNQQWAQETMGSYVRFKNRATGLYLDGMGSTANGSNLCQWGNSGSTNQQWQIQ
ncbi:MAG: endo-1,4-beta-xylanase, partial [Firmicutes bacterium]|nr:endo-1,4-beta-xylanase [Bacillota bacterium]